MEEANNKKVLDFCWGYTTGSQKPGGLYIMEVEEANYKTDINPYVFMHVLDQL